MELTAGSDSRKRGLQIMKKVQGSPRPLGVTIGTESMNFAVSVPPGKLCERAAVPGWQCGRWRQYIPCRKTLRWERVRFLALEGLNPQEYEYNYRIGGEGHSGSICEAHNRPP